MAKELFQSDPYARACTAVVSAADPQSHAFAASRTVFYPTGGGQPGDQGWATLSNGEQIDIVDTRRSRDTGEILHYCSAESLLPEPASGLHLEIDWDRRHRLMRMHSCLHLLCALIPAQVTGGQIYPDRGRLDFDMGQTVDKRQLEQSLNRLVLKRSACDIRWISDEELDANPKLVRTMAVQPPRGAGMVRLVHFKGIDLQPCGGTHVADSSEIGPVRIEKIEKKGRKNRRVTVVFDD